MKTTRKWHKNEFSRLIYENLEVHDRTFRTTKPLQPYIAKAKYLSYRYFYSFITSLPDIRIEKFFSILCRTNPYFNIFK